MTRARPALLLALLGPAALFGRADRMDAGPSAALYNRGSFTVYTENDKYYGGTDQYYTNGAQFTWLSPELTRYDESRARGAASWAPSFLPRWVERLDRLHDEERTMNVGLSVAQYMFTPSDITDPDPPLDDRPYAGWLNVGFLFYSKSSRVLDSFELNLGMVGPASLAEPAQKIVHEIIDAPEPLGWDTQLKNEPTVNLFFSRKLRTAHTLVEDFGFDAMFNVGGALGNAMVYAQTGAELRAGWNLPRNFGTATMDNTGSPPLPLQDAFNPEQSIFRYFGIHAYAGVRGRYVLHNIFLDGNTFTDSRSVEREPWVGDLRAGVGAHYKNWQLNYTMAFRTKEFEGQPEAARYGSIALSVSL